MSDQDVVAPDTANQGEGAGRPGPGDQGDVSPKNELEALRKEIEGLRTGMLAERDKRHATERQLAETNGKLQGLTEAGESRRTSEPQISRAQLREKVAAGEITEAEAEQVWEGQFERRLGDRVEKTVKTAVGEAQTQNIVLGQINAYSEIMPEVLTEGSSARQRVQEEYNFLTSTGAPDGLTTQLQALRSAFGPVEALKKVNKGERPETHHQDVGSGTGTDESTSKINAQGFAKGMPRDIQAYYQSQIDRGLITQAAANAEWSYQPKHGRRASA